MLERFDLFLQKVNGTNQPTTKLEDCVRDIGTLPIEAIGLPRILSRQQSMLPIIIVPATPKQDLLT